MNHGIEQSLAQRGQGVGVTFFALDGARDLEGDGHVRDDEPQGLFNGLEEGVGDLPVVGDEAGGFEAANVDVVAQGLFGEQQHGGPAGLALADVVELLQRGQAVGGAQVEPAPGVDLFHKPIDLVLGQVAQSGVVGGVGVPRQLQRLHVEVADFVGVECLVGVGDAFVVAPFGAHGFDREFSHADHHEGFALKLVHFKLGNDGRAGGGLDLHQPFVEALFSERGALNDPLVCHAHEHAATFGVCKGNQCLDAGLVKRGLEFLRLGLAGIDPVLDGVGCHALGVALMLPSSETLLRSWRRRSKAC